MRACVKPDDRIACSSWALESHGQGRATTWEFLPTDGWHADTCYLLTLPDSVSDLESPPRQLGHNLRLRFATVGVHAAPALPTGAVSGSARSGNLLLVAAPDQGVVAWDISDLARPARLATYAMTGTPSRDVASTAGGWSPRSAAPSTARMSSRCCACPTCWSRSARSPRRSTASR